MFVTFRGSIPGPPAFAGAFGNGFFGLALAAKGLTAKEITIAKESETKHL